MMKCMDIYIYIYMCVCVCVFVCVPSLIYFQCSCNFCEYYKPAGRFRSKCIWCMSSGEVKVVDTSNRVHFVHCLFIRGN